MTIKEMLFLLSGENDMSVSEHLAEIASWDFSRAATVLAGLPVRYEEATGKEMPNYVGLTFCSDMITYLQSEPGGKKRYDSFITACRYKLMYYHNVQFNP